MRSPEQYSHYTTHVIAIEDAHTASSSVSLTHPSFPNSSSKTRKVERACDFCRRRKTRCDGPQRPGNVCTNCIQSHKSCTYVESSKPRGPPKAYVTALEDRVENLEAYLQKVRPGVDFSEVLGPPIIRGSWKNEPPGRQSRSPQAATSASPQVRRTPSTPSITPGYLASSFAASFAGPDWASSSTSGPPRRSAFIHRRASLSTASLVPGTQMTDDPVSDTESVFSDSTPSDSECYGELDYGEEVKRLMARSQVPGLSDYAMSDSENVRAGGEDDSEVPCSWRRFHGKSSSFRLVGPAREMKRMHMTEMANESRSQPPEHKSPERRKEFWTIPSWEIAFEGTHIAPAHFSSIISANMPPPDLAENLILLYFRHSNTQFPLLHRPTFHKLWSSGYYQHDVWFTCLCFTLFAVASRWSDDERVLCEVNSITTGLPQAPSEEELPKVKWRTAGWKYHNVAYEITIVKRSVLQTAPLFEIQSYILMSTFLRGSNHYPISWFIIEVGVRKAQDKGIHRKKAYNDVPPAEAELWKRAWWHLVAFDRVTSAALGRSCCTRDEDFDIDLPLEVDDEYWGNDDLTAFQQPPGKPSLVTAFNSWIRLTQITAFAVRTFYSVEKSQGLLRLFGPKWRTRMVDHMNAALMQWFETVPVHLRWSPIMDSQTFADQALTLFTTYHLARIMIYRPFIRAPDASSEPASPQRLENVGLTICTEAAKTCARMIDIQLQRGLSNVSNLISVSHICAALLLMNVWDIKARYTMETQGSHNTTFDVTSIPMVQDLLSDVGVFLRALEHASDKWSVASTHLSQLKNSLPSTFDYSRPVKRPVSGEKSSVGRPRMFDCSLSLTGSQNFTGDRRSTHRQADEWTFWPGPPEGVWPTPYRAGPSPSSSFQQSIYPVSSQELGDARRVIPKPEPMNEEEDLQVLRTASMPNLALYHHMPMQLSSQQAFDFTERPPPFISRAGRPSITVTAPPQHQQWQSSTYQDPRSYQYPYSTAEGHPPGPPTHPGFTTSAVRNTHAEQRVEDRLGDFIRGGYRWNESNVDPSPSQSHLGGIYRNPGRGRGDQWHG